MKAIITHLEKISSKKGEFVKGSFLNPKTGSTGEFFTTAEKYGAFSFNEAKVATSGDLSKIAEDLEVVDVEFDQNGRLVGIS